MIQTKDFGKLPDGRTIRMYTITNAAGEYVEVLNYGAALHSICVKDKNGKIGDVVHGAVNVEELTGRSKEGFVIGRCANRIAFGRFELNGKTVQLEQGRGGHYLHGGSGNYAHKLFDVVTDEKEGKVILTVLDKGEAGFGCDVDAKVIYSFDDNGRVGIEYDLYPHGDTLLCPTNHAYFNLNGEGEILDHTLHVYGDSYPPKGETGIPEGAIASVHGTPLDFSVPISIKEALASDKTGFFVRQPAGYDDTVLFDKTGYDLSAELVSPTSGRVMRIWTDMPALIIFTPFSEEKFTGKRGAEFNGYSAICLETQFIPNAINCPTYESPLFRKGQRLITKTIYAFDTIED